MQVLSNPCDIQPSWWLRGPPGKKGDGKAGASPEEKAHESESDSKEAILCRQCHQMLTSPAERISIQGSHQHTFANPHGIVFQIGCFRTVQGCGYVGPATAEWSWFKGYSWRVAMCSMCLTHLGWLFVGKADESFNGLILDRLVSSN